MAPFPLWIVARRWTAPGALILACGLAGAASAQTMSTNSANYNAGYGRTAGSENQPVNVSMRDASGNLVIAGGQVLSSTGGSVFSTSTTGGAGSSATGVGVGVGATAIGNSLTVVTTGSYNTVIVNSHQTNTGAITATTSTNGGVGNAQ
jgi:holdfast attachment protein HfaA